MEVIRLFKAKDKVDDPLTDCSGWLF